MADVIIMNVKMADVIIMNGIKNVIGIKKDEI